MYEDDIFVEEMVVRRKTILNHLATLGMILAGIAVIILVWLVVPFISTVLIIIVGFAVYLGVKFQYVEYEYSFTNGDLDIDKIMAKRKRTRELEINQRQVKVMAPYTAEYESETRDYKVSEVKDFSSSKNAAGRWFLIYEKTDGSYAFVVIQPSPRLREAMAKYMRSRMKGMTK
jgi:hypothetical protein